MTGAAQQSARTPEGTSLRGGPDVEMHLGAALVAVLCGFGDGAACVCVCVRFVRVVVQGHRLHVLVCVCVCILARACVRVCVRAVVEGRGSSRRASAARRGAS